MIIASEPMPSEFSKRVDQTSVYPDPLNTFIWNAIVERATDVHLHSVEGGVRVLLRVDGLIHPKIMMPVKEGKRLLNQLKTAASMTVARTFEPLEGNMKWHDGDTTWDIRVTLTPVGDRESAHLRFMSVPTDQWNMGHLGFDDEHQDTISSVIHQHDGLVLLTGPTSSGKTTTMYSLASLLDLSTNTAYTIEDPVEFKLPFAQQIEVDERHGLTMHEGLRTILRMDPDVIMVGEIRDRDSAIVAARAALSGRLVLATVHARTAIGAVDALHGLGVPRHMLGASLRMVIGQKLVRRLCPECAQKEVLDDRQRALYEQYGMECPEQHLVSTGCATCYQHGYQGRVGVYEVAAVDPAMGARISSESHHHELTDALREQGVKPLLYDGLQKVASGMTSFSELDRVGITAHGAKATMAVVQEGAADV